MLSNFLQTFTDFAEFSLRAPKNFGKKQSKNISTGYEVTV
jgi:hypothetical protein